MDLACKPDASRHLGILLLVLRVAATPGISCSQLQQAAEVTVRDLHRPDVAPGTFQLPGPAARSPSRQDTHANDASCSVAISAGPEHAAIATGRRVCIAQCVRQEADALQHSMQGSTSGVASGGRQGAPAEPRESSCAVEQSWHDLTDDVKSLAAGGAHFVAAQQNGAQLTPHVHLALLDVLRPPESE